MPKKGDILTSKKGENWKVLSTQGRTFTAGRYYKGTRVATVSGLDMGSFKKPRKK